MIFAALPTDLQLNSNINFDHLQQEDESQGNWIKTKDPRKAKTNAKQTHNNAKGCKKQRKPDRQLYSVRGKRNQNEESSANGYLSEVSSPFLKSFEGKNSVFCDDDKSFVSTVSTAISDRQRNLDEDMSLIKEDKKEKNCVDQASPRNSSHEPRILFSICLETQEGFKTVVIYEDEENYEELLDNICEVHNITEREALYFKINILKMIQEAHHDSPSLNDSLDKLLDINYNLVMAEIETGDGNLYSNYCVEAEDFDFSGEISDIVNQF